MNKSTKNIIGTYMQILEVWRLTLISNNINVAFYYEEGCCNIVINMKFNRGEDSSCSKLGVRYEIPLYTNNVKMMIDKYIEHVIAEMVRKLIVKNFDINNQRIGG